MKRSDYVKYLGLELLQDDGMFCFNSDTTALGMSFDMMWGKSVLDIGCGSGALLLYAYAKKAKTFYGIDLFEEAIALAKENLSKVTDDHHFFAGRIQDLYIDPVDVIVCNPPFFEMNNVTPDDVRKKAMFEESLPLEDLFSAYRRLLKDNGEIYMIYPADRFPELYQKCIDHKLKIMKMRFLHDRNSDYALRVILKLKIGKMTKLRILRPFVLRDGELEEL